jgi:hypothetical protein
MKRFKNVKTVAWALGFVIPASHAFAAPLVTSQVAPKQKSAAQNVDMTIAGPGGEVLVFYRDGSDVIIRNCGKDYPSVQKRSDCAQVGPENRIPLESFKSALKSEFQFSGADKLKPLTPDEVKAYRSADTTKVDALKWKEKSLSEKLARIQEFVKLKGADDQTKQDQAATQKLLDQARAQLGSAKAGSDAVQKVNDLINQVIDQITVDGNSASGMYRFSSQKNSDEAMYTLLKAYDPSGSECGTDDILNGTRPAPGNENPGDTKSSKAAFLKRIFMIPEALAREITTDDRIANCANLPGAVKKAGSDQVRWNLVSRQRDRSTGKFYEVWKDSTSGLLWGDRLDSNYTHYNAVELSVDGKRVVSEKACAGDEAKRANTGLREKTFGLPTIEEFQQAEKDGVREVVPNMSRHWYWSASRNPYDAHFAWEFSGNYGVSDYDFRDDDFYSVRCVGR